MESHGSPRLSMDAIGKPWMPMDIHGCPWKTMAAHGHPWMPMENHGCPWISMDAHGTPWMPMDIHGKENGAGPPFRVQVQVRATLFAPSATWAWPGAATRPWDNRERPLDIRENPLDMWERPIDRRERPLDSWKRRSGAGWGGGFVRYMKVSFIKRVSFMIFL